MRDTKFLPGVLALAMVTSGSLAQTTVGVDDTQCSSLKKSSFSKSDPEGQYMLEFVNGGLGIFASNFDLAGVSKDSIAQWNDKKILDYGALYCDVFPKRPLREAGKDPVNTILEGDE